MIHGIFACDLHGGIAKNGVMPWPKNSNDLKHFKDLTTGHTVVMGRRTWEAQDMPSPLPNRHNVVVTRNANYQAPGADVVSDIRNYLTTLVEDSKVFLIGGAQLLTDLIDEIQILHLTRINGSYECDTVIPLHLVEEKFQCVRSESIDTLTTFETHFAREIHDLSIRTKF